MSSLLPSQTFTNFLSLNSFQFPYKDKNMLLMKLSSAFRVAEGGKESKNRYPYASSNKSTVVVGLKIILVQISSGKSNVVVKPALRSTKSASRRQLPPGYCSCKSSADQYSCYLKSCHLCNKKLSLDKEVYMYRGDLGFCSVECRDRQMVLDEIKELEASTKQMLRSYRHCSSGADHRSETQRLIEELRRGRHNNNNNKQQQHYSQKIHWAITS